MTIGTATLAFVAAFSASIMGKKNIATPDTIADDLKFRDLTCDLDQARAELAGARAQLSEFGQELIRLRFENERLREPAQSPPLGFGAVAPMDAIGLFPLCSHRMIEVCNCVPARPDMLLGNPHVPAYIPLD